jgi:muramidase (phage lysozyme)
MSTYKDKDPATDLLLDFIAGGVAGNQSGESGGNYGAYFGHVHSKVDFSSMTLSEVYAFQARMLQDDSRSTALGRYQFLRGTLQGLQVAHKLSGDTKLTNELQDRFGVSLMVRRGFSRWWLEQISDEDLANGLSMEWASLPDPQNGGKSHYDNDSAGNHASTDLGTFLAVIKHAAELRTSKPTPQPPDPPPEPTPTPPPKPLPDPAPTDEIVVGDRGKMVQQVQLNLDVVVDGVYGKTTAGAVAAFQKENKIKVTGTVNKRTWNKLFQWPVT